MKHLIGFVVIFFALFLDTEIANQVGGYKLMYIAVIILILYLVINIVNRKIRYEKIALYIFFLAFCICIFKWAVGQNYLIRVLNFLVTPMLISICYENFTKKDLTLLLRFIIIFYTIECGLSIVEWTLNRNFFVFSEWILVVIYNLDKYEGVFRSTSLLGHPLANAQVVAVFMTFIAVSNFKRKYLQIFLFFLGYVSLFCFNARGAILVVTVFTVPYFIWKINKITHPSKKLIVKFAVFCIICGLAYSITQTPLGGRLMNIELMDSSAQTRINVFEFTNYVNNDDLLWGNRGISVHLWENLGIVVENGILSLILDFGIIFTIPILFLLFLFQYRKLSLYSKIEKWLLLAVFYIIGCMNPNLVLAIQWTMWINAFYAFQHLNTENISSINDNRNFNS